MKEKKFNQNVVVINFKSNITEEEQTEIIRDFYIENEKSIIGMNSFCLKPNLDKYKQIKKTCEE